MSDIPDTLSRPVEPASVREAGFSLAEMIVGLAVMVEVLLLILLLFDVNNRLSRVQTQVAEMQQSQRIGHHEVVKMVRMAGRGGLATRQSVIVETAGPNTQIGDSDSPPVVEDTDIITLRGVYRSPIWSVDYTNPASFTLDTQQGNGQVIIDSISNTRIPQPLDVLEEMIANPYSGNNPRPDALLLVSAVADEIFAVVQVTRISIADNLDLDGDGTNDQRATVSFSIKPNLENNSGYMPLSCCQTGGNPSFPGELDEVAFAGIVDEYRLYIRDSYAVEEDETSEWIPRLSLAQFYPNTDVVWDDQQSNAERNLRIDIADNFLDLQVALALDANDDGQIQEGTGGAPTDSDEWLYNHPGDDDTAANWLTADLHLLRIATLSRSSRADPSYLAPPIVTLLDREYGEAADPASEAERLERLHRRRLLESTVDVRNL